ncbi:MAG: hypothetical protein ACOCRK_09985 [bacterium]
MNKIEDLYGERFDYPIEELMNNIKFNFNKDESLPFDSDKSFKAWLMTPGAMSDYYQKYTDVNIYRRPSYFNIIDMKKYVNLYTAYMQRILSMFENESPYRIAQYEGTIVVLDFLDEYYKHI